MSISCYGQLMFIGPGKAQEKHSRPIGSVRSCLALASSDFFEGGLDKTHTPGDMIDEVDTEMIIPAAEFIRDFTESFEAKPK